MPVGEHSIEITYRPIRTTSEYVAYQVEILGFLEAERIDVDRLVQWTCEHIVDGDPLPPNEKNILDLLSVDGLLQLSALIATGGALPSETIRGYRRLLTVAHKAQDYDPNFDPACECPACTGIVDEHPDCLYAFERPQLSDSLAAIDWKLVQECWSLPFYVYQARLEEVRAQSRGEAVLYQESAKEREEEKEAAKIRKKHFGTSDWSQIGPMGVN